MSWLPHEDAEISSFLPQLQKARERRNRDSDLWLHSLAEPPIPQEFDESVPYECWCGAKGTYKELCDDSGLERGCGGLGVLNCRCGGDLCVCHHHGEIECPGCPECEETGEDDSTI